MITKLKVVRLIKTDTIGVLTRNSEKILTVDMTSAQAFQNLAVLSAQHGIESGLVTPVPALIPDVPKPKRFRTWAEQIMEMQTVPSPTRTLKELCALIIEDR